MVKIAISKFRERSWRGGKGRCNLGAYLLMLFGISLLYYVTLPTA